tara:strand:- start:443 stop:952 length:510 start_codon:yes stop_codon:yes gene_type:complete
MNKKAFIILVASAAVGCSAPPVKMNAGASSVKVAKSDPPDNYLELGPVTAIDGKGCGAYGYRGTYDRTVVRLKNKTHGMNGDYVQIFSITEPHFRPGCFDNMYKINGTAFAKVSDQPSPVVIVDKSRAPTPASTSNAGKLRELKALLDEGVITQQEFDEQKAKILTEGL